MAAGARLLTSNVASVASRTRSCICPPPFLAKAEKKGAGIALGPVIRRSVQRANGSAAAGRCRFDLDETEPPYDTSFSLL